MLQDTPQPDQANPRPERKLRVTVLAGGPGAERDVSLQSGQAVADTLRQRGHEVFLADISPADLSALDTPADVVFPALHGTFGEDGTLQGIMEQRGICFVGADSRGSALAMDKIASKQLVLDAGFDTPPYEIWEAAQPDHRDLPELEFPVVVKPADQGSSVATTIVEQPQAFRDALTAVFPHSQRALVEQFIAGEELTVGILADTALPPICIRPKREFYDYQAKYQDDATEYLFDAGYAPALLKRAQSRSLTVFDTLGCRHLGRVDWIVDRDGKLWFLELNTLPGFTSHSLVPKAAAKHGIPFDELVERLVFMALEQSA